MDLTCNPFRLRTLVLVTFGGICVFTIALDKTLLTLPNKNQRLGNRSSNWI